MMRPIILGGALASLTSLVGVAPARAESVHDLMRCTGTLLGAPTYVVQTVDAGEAPTSYRVVVQPNNPFYGPYTLEVPYERVTRYDDVFILTVDQGRSGYAHIFSHGDVAVIDIDLFDRPELQTHGASTSYRCVFADITAKAPRN